MMLQRFKRVGCVVMLSWSASMIALPMMAAEPSTISSPGDVESASGLSKVFREVAVKASPGIVTVYALRGSRMTIPMRMREQSVHGHPSEFTIHRHAASSPVESPDDQGSGVVIDRQGYVLTCSHVVQNANAVFVRTSDGRKFHAEKISCDPVSDLAVIKLIGATDLHEIKLADSDDLSIGDWVVSLASPYDMERSVSAGIVSSTKRWVSSSPYPLIQNDACTNPGSSGGALLNLRGEVVGIIEGALTTTGKFQGIGLATPINVAKDIAEQLHTKGYVDRNYFGFQTQPLSAEMAKLLDSSIKAGLYVKDVAPRSPADQSGLREGDIIIGLDGVSMDKDFDAETFGPTLTAGDHHHLSLIRDHAPLEIDIQQNGSQGEATDQPIRETICERCFEHFDTSLGLGLSQLTPMLAEELKLPESARGALITHVAFDSEAYREGVAAGMVVARVNDRPVNNLQEYEAIVGDLNGTKPVLLLLQSNQGKHLVLLPSHNERHHEQRKD